MSDYVLCRHVHPEEEGRYYGYHHPEGPHACDPQNHGDLCYREVRPNIRRLELAIIRLHSAENPTQLAKYFREAMEARRDCLSWSSVVHVVQSERGETVFLNEEMTEAEVVAWLRPLTGATATALTQHLRAREGGLFGNEWRPALEALGLHLVKLSEDDAEMVADHFPLKFS